MQLNEKWDDNLMLNYIEGDTKLFDSVKSLLEGDFAEKVKEQFKRYQDYLIEEENEELQKQLKFNR